MADNSRHLDLPRGFHDSTPERAATYERLRRDWFATCSLAGYQPVEVPPVGFQDTFTHGHHAAGNRLYPLTDRSGRELALVSDSLPAVLRLAHSRRLREQRLSYCCPVFRYVRRPRRYFHQLGLMEVVAGPSDLAVQHRSTRRLAQVVATFLAPRLKVRFTAADPGLWRDLIANTNSAQSELLDSLRRHPARERPGLLSAAGCSPEIAEIANALADDASMSSEDAKRALSNCPPGVRDRVTHAHDLAAAIRQCGASCEVDLGCLHASEFHDGPAFQVRPEQGRLLGDGGTYDVFASAFLGTVASANSAIIGLERLADLQGDGPQCAADVATIAHPDAETIAHAEALNLRLRHAGIRVWDVVQTARLDHHLRDIAAVGIPLAIVVGQRELDSAICTVRDSSGALHTVSQQDLPTWLADRLPRDSRGTPR